MRGIVEGRMLMGRVKNAMQGGIVREGKHNKPLNAYLGKVNEAVRGAFHGLVTYAALPWEQVDWGLFDFIGVDHYRATRVKDRYKEMIEPLFERGKPVVAMEFGYCTYHVGALDLVGGERYSNPPPALGRRRLPLLNLAHPLYPV